MSDLWLNFNQGLYHIIDGKAYEHILFLAIICAAYTFSDWKRILISLSIFTIVNSLSILLAAYNVVRVSQNLVLFLIPFTIVLVGTFNLFTAGKEKQMEKLGIIYIAATFYGFTHGMIYHQIFSASINGKKFLALIGYSFGVEIGQILIAISILILGIIFQSMLRFNKRDWVLVISALGIGLAIPMLMKSWLF